MQKWFDKPFILFPFLVPSPFLVQCERFSIISYTPFSPFPFTFCLNKPLVIGTTTYGYCRRPSERYVGLIAHISAVRLESRSPLLLQRGWSNNSVNSILVNGHHITCSTHDWICLERKFCLYDGFVWTLLFKVGSLHAYQLISIACAKCIDFRHFFFNPIT